MIRLKKILCPTDFSDNAGEAMKYACAFADQFGSELHVLYVLQDLTLIMPEPGAIFSVPALDEKEMQASAERLLSHVPAADWCTGKSIVRCQRTGSPYVEIVNYANENAIDLIVMGTHGRTGLPHILMGSVAEKVVRKAGCPVLTVHPANHSFLTS